MISFCIGVKNRWRWLERSLLSLGIARGQEEIEVILVDYDSDDVDDLFSSAKVILKEIPLTVIHAEGYFAKSKAHNKAVEGANGDILFFSDTDIWYPRKFAWVVKNWTCSERDAFFPIVRFLDKDSGLCEDAPGFDAIHSFGMCGISRENFEKVGPWDESVKGGGGEDRLFHQACVDEGLYVHRFLVPGLFHLWHPRDWQWKEQHHEPGERYLEGARH